MPFVRPRRTGGIVVAALLTVVAVVGGVVTYVVTPARAVMGGVSVGTRAYPWMVALRWAPTVSGGTVGFCDGTLIAPTKVLTAGHCASRIKNVAAGQSASTPLSRVVRVVVGRDDLSTSRGTEIPVKALWLHPKFSRFTFKGETGYRNDVAVLTLTTAVSTAVLPVATNKQTNLLRAGVQARILGWGATGEKNTKVGVLRSALVPVVADQRCRGSESYGSSYDAALAVCAGNYDLGGVDTCSRDSGSPLVVQGVVVGITSWGLGCGRAKYPGLYTRVSTFSTDIRAHTKA
jgi:secreted trypsin-like serine protease